MAPGPIRRPLASLATFERTGRRPAGEQKIVKAYHNVPQAITVPRGLLAQAARLAPLRVIDRRLAFEPVDFGWRGELYPYQAAAAKEIYRLGGGVVVMCPGGGKTITGLALAATWGQPTLWLVHTRELARQAMDRARQVYRLPPSAYGTVIDGLGPGENQRPIFTVAMVQSLANNPSLTVELAGRVGTVIQDECFPAGTLVDGRPIEEIREGDAVWAWDEETGELARRRVVRAMKRPSPPELVRVSAAGCAITCTADHPVRTTAGWVRASELKVGETVFLLEGNALREGRISQANRVTAPSGSVYNLEIEGAHTYFAGGILVHNCHHTPAESFRRVVGRMPARYKAGLSVGGGASVSVEHSGIVERLTITELSRRFGVGLDEVARVSDYRVWSYDPKQGRFAWAELKAVHRYANTKKVLRINAAYGRSITLTDDHSVFRVADGGRAATKSNGWRRLPRLEVCKASDVRPGDYVLVEDRHTNPGPTPDVIDCTEYLDGHMYISGDWETQIPVVEPGHGGAARNRRHFWSGHSRLRRQAIYGPYVPLSIFRANRGILPLSEDSRIYSTGDHGHWLAPHLPVEKFARLLGLIAGDGAISPDRVSLIVGKHQVGAILDYLRTLDPYMSLGVTVKEPSRSGSAREIVICCRPLVDLVTALFGGPVKAPDKRVPPPVFTWSAAAKRAFVDGLITADGHLRISGTRAGFTVTTVSRGLANDLLHLLSHLGVVAGLHVAAPRLGGTVQGRQIVGRWPKHDVFWSAYSYFGDNDGCKGGRMGFEMGAIEGRPVVVRSIEDASEAEVFDLSVGDDCQSFLADGILVHNSATPDRTDGLGPLMEAMLGKLVPVPLKVLVDAGRVLLPRIELVGTSFEAWADGDERTVWNQFEALRAQDAERNRLIVALAMRALAARRRVLILVTRRDHAHFLAKVLTAKGAQAFAATGEAQETQRARWFGLLQEGRCIVIATRLADEGLDLPRLDTLILAAAASSKVRLEQQIGRVMRTAGGKKDAIVYDLCDTLVPTYKRQVQERLDYYRDVGYELRGWTARGNAHE